MCLDVDNKKTDALRNSPDKVFTRYKVVRRIPAGFQSVCYYFMWEVGWNEAKWQHRALSDVAANVVTDGIHVIIDKEVAESVAELYNIGWHACRTPSPISSGGGVYFVMEVTTHKEDLIAVGRSNLIPGGHPTDTEAYWRVKVEKLPQAVALEETVCYA